MKIVIKHFGEAVITALVLGLLVFLLFGSRENGVLYQMHDKMPEVKSVYAASAGNDEFSKVISSGKPQIAFRDTLGNGTKNTVRAKAVYNLTDLFLATDANGNELEVTVKDVTEKSTGISLLWEEDKAAGERKELQKPDAFAFPSAGTYLVNLVAADANGVIVKKTIAVPVLGR